MAVQVHGQDAQAEAAEQRLTVAARASGERMSLVPGAYAFALLLVLAAALGLVAWSVLGTVGVTVRLTGVIVHGSGPVTVASPVDGSIAQLTVQPGAAVTVGQVVGTVRGTVGVVPIKAPATGHVIDVLAPPGSQVTASSPVMSVDSTSTDLTGLTFEPESEGFGVSVGERLTAQTSSSGSAVTVSGTVAAVGSYPLTAAEISRMLGGLPATMAVSGPGPWRLVTVRISTVGITGTARLRLTGTMSAGIPGLISLLATVQTAQVRPVNMLFGGSS